ncbi:Tyrosine-protein phosphatase 1 [Candida viswanathii]|uniref:protein-tyrosine-phosphatase n=1 Tax=Candida viswanathii TaxID=5486 RepID=A0A367YPF7_9ASCO|nr:Tyrosine-protein phosphatase 1 [Candida viswanathii]
MNIFKKPISAVTNGITSITSNDVAATNGGGNNNHSHSHHHNGITPPRKSQVVIKVSPQKQRDNFNELNEIESQRIIEGLNNPDTSIWSITSGISRVNRSRNRYTNVTPWDRTRVKLPVVDETTHSDYINASHIHLRTSRDKVCNRYIACQGPLESTIHHFWAMAFNELEHQGNDVVVIVMVTPLVESDMVKCAKYWPELDEIWDLAKETKDDGIDLQDLSVKNVGEDSAELDDYVITELELTANGKTKKVYHFYYYKWADAKTPPSIQPLSDLSARIHEIRESSTDAENRLVPIVHCSAGVGRSGTFIVYDHLFRDVDVFRTLARADGTSDKDLVYQAVCQLRSQRMMMVQTVYQYSFLYDVARTFYK